MSDYQAISDPRLERRLSQRRVFVVLIVVFLLCIGLVARYYSLQIKHHERYATLSDENRIHVRTVPPTRGLIYDRNGVILAENLPSYTLSIVRERAENIDKLLLDLKELIGLTDQEIQQFQTQRNQFRRPYDGIELRYQLSEVEVAKLAVNEYRLPGIEVEVQLIRHYPLGQIYAHTLGYVGRINAKEKARFDPDLYEGTRVTGKTGVEKQYEDSLLGLVGYEHVETDARGNVLRVLEREDPVPGQNIWLHLDSRLQAKIYELLEGKRASMVAIDVKTGGVLAMASLPSFDPNLFVTGISSKNYNSLLYDGDKPLFDRSVYGQYPPGSTLKPMYGLAGIAEGIVSPDFSVNDFGFFQLPNEERRFRDWKKEGHGKVDLRVAIEQSCDVYFYELGYKAGIDILSKYGSLFGLGKSTGIDLPSESYGVMPSRDWKREYRRFAWYPGDTINASIGQGYTLTTPLQLANMTAILARRGGDITPSILRAMDQPHFLFENPETRVVEAQKDHWDLVYQGMEDVLHAVRGTAYSVSKGMNYRMAGKTGTAQVVGIDQDAEYDSEQLKERQRDHALFVGFAPAEEPRIAVSVILENGELSTNAAMLARKLIDEWMRLDKLDTDRIREQELLSEFDSVASQEDSSISDATAVVGVLTPSESGVDP